MNVVSRDLSTREFSRYKPFSRLLLCSDLFETLVQLLQYLLLEFLFFFFFFSGKDCDHNEFALL